MRWLVIVRNLFPPRGGTRKSWNQLFRPVRITPFFSVRAVTRGRGLAFNVWHFVISHPPRVDSCERAGRAKRAPHAISLDRVMPREPTSRSCRPIGRSIVGIHQLAPLGRFPPLSYAKPEKNGPRGAGRSSFLLSLPPAPALPSRRRKSDEDTTPYGLAIARGHTMRKMITEPVEPVAIERIPLCEACHQPIVPPNDKSTCVRCNERWRAVRAIENHYREQDFGF